MHFVQKLYSLVNFNLILNLALIFKGTSCCHLTSTNPRLMPYKFYAGYTFLDIFSGPRCLEQTHDFPPLGSSSPIALYCSAWCYWGCQAKILSPHPSWLPIHNHDLPILPPKYLVLAPSSVCTHCPVTFPAQTVITTDLHYCNILLIPDRYLSRFSSVQAEWCFRTQIGARHPLSLLLRILSPRLLSQLTLACPHTPDAGFFRTDYCSFTVFFITIDLYPCAW